MAFEKTTVPSRLMIVALILVFSATYVKLSEPLNIYFPEKMLFQYDNKPYIRVYQAVFSEGAGVSTTAYPNLQDGKFKDIYKDQDGNIIIYPDKGIIDRKLFVGIGDYQNQLKFIREYSKTTKHQQGATNPLIKSFIVPYDVVYEIAKKVVREERDCNKEASVNVDIHYSNQFGLNLKHATLLRVEALPDSLVTFAKQAIDNPGRHLGKFKVVSADELKSLWDAKGIAAHPPPKIDDPITNVMPPPNELVMSKVPKITAGPLETGITNDMLKKSEKHKKRWENAKRFQLGIKSFIESIRNLKLVEKEEKKKIGNQEEEALEILYAPVKDVNRKIDGGFLVGLGDSDQSRKLNEMVLEFALNRKMEKSHKDIAINQMKKVVEDLKQFDSFSIWYKFCDVWNYMKDKFGKK